MSSKDESVVCLTRREALQGMVGVVAGSILTGANAAPAWSENAQTGHHHGYILPFDTDWRFYRGDAPGAETAGFDDSSWRTLDVPHDWSIEDRPTQSDQNGEGAIWTQGTNPVRVGPFDLYASEGQISTGWTVGGIGWYRKTFQAPQVPASGKAEVRFEGVYMNADVWLNGRHLGNHPYGYTGFSFDLTPALKPGANTLAVRVNNTGKNSRWYSGSGIFRKVWLSTAGVVRIPEYGVWVTFPQVQKDLAALHVETTVENGASTPQHATIQVRVRHADGPVVASGQCNANIPANARANVVCELKIANPHLWSPKDPSLHQVEVTVEADGKHADTATLHVGIRKIEIDAEHGLRINGEPYKMRGGCVHHDNGALGSACIPRAEERRVEILKANGYNAIRTSHNPPSRDFLDACDRLGMLVIDEAFDCWESGNKNPQDYHLYFKEWWQRDLRSMILRDRNHPCVVLWSIGNEINERAEPSGMEIGKLLSAYAKKLDPTRLVTAAICGPWDHPGKTWKDMQPAFTYLDVGGYNYQWQSYETDHATYPQRVMVGTESFPNEAFQNWQSVEKNSFVLGDFVWTAIDYLGESGIGHASVSTQSGPDRVFSPFYPWFNSYCGDIDLIGNKKPQSYFRDVVWERSKIEMAVQRPIPHGYHEQISKWGWSDELQSWTWPGSEGSPVQVRVYTRGDRVRLLLNGKEVGVAALTPKDNLVAEFSVPYSPGELKAIAYQNGAELAAISFKTVGPARKLVLTPDKKKLRASRDELSYVMVQVVDESGNVLPDASVPVSFTLIGAGELAAVGNANPKNVASFREPHRSTFHGTCVAIVRPSGKAGSISLKAESRGLQGAAATIEVA